MATQIQVEAIGTADVLRDVQVPTREPEPGQVRIRQTAIGVNFMDVYHRRGTYPLQLPGVPGMAGAGVIDAVGAGVAGLTTGQRVAYLDVQPGAYTTHRLISCERAIRLPDAVEEDVAAASILRGLTAHMLLTRVHAINAGTVLLVHSAAGGLGQLIVRWAKRLGASVIATVGSENKRFVAEDAGADQVLVRTPDLPEALMQMTNGQGADLVVDGLGGTSLQTSLRCVRRFGTVASVGQAAGPTTDISVAEIGRRSASLSCPSVIAYAADLASYRAGAAALFEALAEGLMVSITERYPLPEAAAAHRKLESGTSTGSLLLIP